MAAATTIDLSSNDAKVLSALFDSEASLSNTTSIIRTAEDIPGIPQNETQRLSNLQSQALREINSEHPSPEAIKFTLQALDEIIKSQPQFAPAYANRAQARRLQIEEDDAIFLSKNEAIVNAVVQDLQQAVAIASPKSPTESASELQAKVLSNAHTHLGYLYLLASREGSVENIPLCLVSPNGAPAGELASYHFALGGKYGHALARELAVRTNPYAKLCGEMVKQALKKEMAEASAQFVK